MNYFKCKIFNDGKYLIFDKVFFYLVKESKVEVFVEFYDYWKIYLLIIMKFINMEFFGVCDFGIIYGLYLFEFEFVKKYQVKDKVVMI